jgi:hypothetical protein
MGSVALQKLNAKLAATVPAPPPQATDAEILEHHRASRHLAWVLQNLKAALAEDWFVAPLQSTNPLQLRDDAVIVRMIHNPTANAVVVTLSLDAGSPPLFSASLAAGQVVEMHLPMPRITGFVGSGMVTITGELVN